MNNKSLVKTGLIGTVILALCCFTPILVVLLGVVGLSAVVGYLDYVLVPALGVFMAILLYALWRRQRSTNKPTDSTANPSAGSTKRN